MFVAVTVAEYEGALSVAVTEEHAEMDCENDDDVVCVSRWEFVTMGVEQELAVKHAVEVAEIEASNEADINADELPEVL